MVIISLFRYCGGSCCFDIGYTRYSKFLPFNRLRCDRLPDLSLIPYLLFLILSYIKPSRHIP
ncbi:hypothetical protein NEOLEDRAFT_603304 [Neolentinus lepideus HHB14362 ss-1]|uniref:Uncharacterized protein n=1 Tax=Neolentinus lepideus HHB14362 ss-1 TaxID=1314782 RepID=A0A165VC55_9AGAM|nr:hypothetical protein NEOLEDRAFT_603304 [Neolentinus lepideus HHB14362 ss-1]